MKKLYLFVLLTISLLRLEAQIQDKWDTVFKVFPNPNNVEFRLKALVTSSNNIMLFGDSVFDPTSTNTIITNAKIYNTITNTITNSHYSKSIFDGGFTSVTSVNTNSPNLKYNYFTTQNDPTSITTEVTLYRQNSQTGVVSKETSTTVPANQFGYTHATAAFSPLTNNDSITVFEKDAGVIKIRRKKFNQIGTILSNQSINVNNVEKSIVYNNRLLVAAKSATSIGDGELYESTDGINFTFNSSIASFLTGGTKITDMEVFNGTLYFALYVSDGYFSIIKTNDLINFTSVSTVNFGGIIYDFQVFKNKLWFIYTNGSSGNCGECVGRPSIECIESNTSTTSIVSTDTLGRPSNNGDYFRLAVSNNNMYAIGGNNNESNLANAGIFVYRIKAPLANFTPSNIPQTCINSILSFTNTSLNADSVRWIRDNNFYASTNNTYSTSFSTVGSHTIGLIAIIGTLKDTLLKTFNTYSVSASLSLLNNNACANSSITINSTVNNGVAPLTYTLTQVVPSNTVVSNSSSYTAFNVPSGIRNYSFVVKDANGCSGVVSSFSVNVLPSQVINVNVTSTLAAVNGSVTLYRYEQGFTKFDSVDTKIITAGVASFTATPSNSYIAMAIPTATDMLVTYGTNANTWFLANVFQHGCLTASSNTINVLSITNIGTGPGVLTGTVIEGIGYGSKSSSFVPGGPIRGTLIKVGREPGGDIVAQGRTLPNGTYSFANLPLNNPGESYRVIPDIPGLDTNGTYIRTILSSSTIFSNLDFVVDSTRINTTNYVGIKKELEKLGKLTLYPNPVNTTLNLKFELMNIAVVKIEMIDVLGRLQNPQTNSFTLKEGKNDYKIDVSGLINGVYFLNVNVENQSSTFKVIIQH